MKEETAAENIARGAAAGKPGGLKIRLRPRSAAAHDES